MSNLDIEIQERILRLWNKMIFTTMFAVQNFDMAKDIVQDTALKVLESSEKLQEVDNIDGYIFGILFKTIADTDRKKVITEPLSNVPETFFDI